jgi:hypothetical protein
MRIFMAPIPNFKLRGAVRSSWQPACHAAFGIGFQVDRIHSNPSLGELSGIECGGKSMGFRSRSREVFHRTPVLVSNFLDIDSAGDFLAAEPIACATYRKAVRDGLLVTSRRNFKVEFLDRNPLVWTGCLAPARRQVRFLIGKSHRHFLKPPQARLAAPQ